MRPKKRRAMRCEYCGSLETVKNGSRVIGVMSFGLRTTRAVSRYRCQACGRYFSRRREKGKKYTVGMKLELARMHVEERMSYRVMAKRIRERFGKRVSPRVLCEMVNEVTSHAKGSLAIRREYQPRWSGYLLIDDKYVSVRGRKLLSLVAADSSGDALHSEVLEETDQGQVTDFLRFIVERLGYPLKAVTTDFDGRFGKALEALDLGHILHQRCIWHGMQVVRRMLNHPVLRQKYWQLKARLERAQREEGTGRDESSSLEDLLAQFTALEREYQRQRALLGSLKEILYGLNPTVSHERFRAFCRTYRRLYPHVTAWLEDHLELMLVHQQDRKIPQTNNIAENLNRQIQRRFKTIEAFQSVETAWNYQNLIRNYLRLKPYTDCRGSRRRCNGKSPWRSVGSFFRTMTGSNMLPPGPELSAAK